MLNDKVPDLKICQEAKEKGVEIESKFWWWLHNTGPELKNFNNCPTGGTKTLSAL